MSTRTVRQRIPALDPTCASDCHTSTEIRRRERRRPGFHFCVQDRRSAFLETYPGLAVVFAAHGVSGDYAPVDAGADPLPFLYDLARAANPPYRCLITGEESISELVDELANHQHAHFRSEMARLDLLITRVSDAERVMDLRSLRCGWEIFRDSLLEHFHDEETVSFPNCLAQAAAANQTPEMRMADERQLMTMTAGHHQALVEIGEMLVLGARAQEAAGDHDLAVIMRGLEAMREALIIHTRLEGEVLLPLCLRAAASCAASGQQREMIDPDPARVSPFSGEPR